MQIIQSSPIRWAYMGWYCAGSWGVSSWSLTSNNSQPDIEDRHVNKIIAVIFEINWKMFPFDLFSSNILLTYSYKHHEMWMRIRRAAWSWPSVRTSEERLHPSFRSDSPEDGADTGPWVPLMYWGCACGRRGSGDGKERSKGVICAEV